MLKSAVLIALLALVVACGANSSQTMQTTPSPSDTAIQAATPDQQPDEIQTVIIGEGRPPIARAESLQLMTEGDEVVVGRVVKVSLPYDPRPGYLGWTPSVCPFPPDHPKFSECSWTPSPEELLRPPGRGFTDYAIEVLRALGASGPTAGETIFVRQVGGIWEGVAYQLEGDPLLKIGETYLLALTPNSKAAEENGNSGPGYSTDVAFTRFIVDGNANLQPVDQMWASLPAVKALTGQKPEAALAAVQAARTESAP